MTSFSESYLNESARILQELDPAKIEALARAVRKVRDREGRIFFIGVGGSAANASHAVNDFRKICGIESYTPTDNVAELTARINDDGWDSCLAEWLKASRMNSKDALFIFSVGGGDLKRNISPNLVRAVDAAKTAGASVLGVVGRDGGYTARMADACVVVPTVNPETVTPHTEAFQAVVWHLLVTHPDLKAGPTKWESSK
ncbi:MAG: sugar isomerase [Elusimicrobia bacterium RIFCSPLOWO2_01_FULL_64_13]|nr:MAG: sugar isomerase [Elusimicrobia bacterium RIFCSPHIGHO2_01_FULL_64_10]OGR98185.1 MAG: sugar isomerase [Elusimicrobia bacterium RIFCSPLOWO2_01_FULL_64_13]